MGAFRGRHLKGTPEGRGTLGCSHDRDPLGSVERCWSLRPLSAYCGRTRSTLRSESAGVWIARGNTNVLCRFGSQTQRNGEKKHGKEPGLLCHSGKME